MVGNSLKTQQHLIMDENNFFTSKEEIFGESLILYDKYNWENQITDYNNYIYEISFIIRHN